MELSPISRNEFDARGRRAGPAPSKLTEAVYELKPGTGLEVKNHTCDSPMHCREKSLVYSAAKRRGMKISVRHTDDGTLMVLRLER